MAKSEPTKYQSGVINRYYEHLDLIMLNRLSELVTDLYLADSDSKRSRLWQRVHKAMLNLKIPSAIIEHIMSKRDIEILAKNLNDWLKKTKKP